MKSVLVTGAHGFLGRYVAKCFKESGYRVAAIGYGRWPAAEYAAHGIDEWLEAGIELATLQSVPFSPDVIVHCAGSGSVGFSLQQPFEDFQMTVDSTLAVLEYMRLVCPGARLVYPSSAAVYGAQPDGLISEESPVAPLSPYGNHKLIAERLCQSYTASFNLDVAIIRFFSIYGPGLQKQLLWDACQKLTADNADSILFFGTGRETRDWLHADDAAELILTVAEHDSKLSIINGGSGTRTTIAGILALVAGQLGSNAAITFNGQDKPGDPRFYHADITRARSLGWSPAVRLEQGVASYVRWFKDVR
jgi:UDP-glucose 4-epimerase